MSPPLSTIFLFVTLFAYLCAALRLLTYRRGRARHRRHVSWLAWMLLVALGGSAIEVAVHAPAVGAFDAMRATVLMVFVFVARGNVAHLLRSER